MKSISKIFLQGLLTILPVALTVALLVWLITTLEHYLKIVILWIIPEQSYWPGLGLLLGLGLIFVLGLLVNAYFGKLIVDGLNRLMERIPFIKSIHGAFSELVNFLSPSDKQDLQQAVLFELQPGVEVIGFITNGNENLGTRQGIVAVYVPMSYQIGGFTLFMPREKCKDLDMSTSEAMKKVLTASITSDKNHKDK